MKFRIFKPAIILCFTLVNGSYAKAQIESSQQLHVSDADIEKYLSAEEKAVHFCEYHSWGCYSDNKKFELPIPFKNKMTITIYGHYDKEYACVYNKRGKVMRVYELMESSSVGSNYIPIYSSSGRAKVVLDYSNQKAAYYSFTDTSEGANYSQTYYSLFYYSGGAATFMLNGVEQGEDDVMKFEQTTTHMQCGKG